jgi:PTS system galactitol-specific IIB component
MKKKVLVCCGGGVATSSIVMDELNTLARAHNLEVDFHQCPISELPSSVRNADLIITTVKLYQDYDIPVIHAVNFLTGKNIEQTRNQILEELKK